MMIPVAIFAYNRPDKLKACLASLSRCEFARDTDLYVFLDKCPSMMWCALEVARSHDYFRSVSTIEAGEHLGLKRSIMRGVSMLMPIDGRVIVLEDDLVVSPHFLKWMNYALCNYEYEEDVGCICGYTFPVRHQQDGPFFVRGATSWGWGTWAREWDTFSLYSRIENVGYSCVPYVKMLRDSIIGRNDSWFAHWQHHLASREKLTLYPPQSLVLNNGIGSGTHCLLNHGAYGVELADKCPPHAAPIWKDSEAEQAIKRFHETLAFRKLLSWM